MWELVARMSGSGSRRLGQWFRIAIVLVVALSCAGGDASTLMGPVANPLDLAVVQVTPDAVTIPSGASYQFTALAILPDSVAIVADVIWTATGGTITASGVFTAGTTPGTYQISAQLRGRTRSGSAPVKIAPSLTSLVLSPATVTLAERATQQFAIAGTWSDGSATVPAVTYTVTGGTITSSGLYTAGTTPGTFSVIATQQGGSKADTAIVNIAAPAVILLQMVLTPASVALAPAGTAQFSVAGTWSDGGSRAPAVTFSATGGMITAGGLYTAGATAGTFRVIAAQTGGPKVDTSVVTITAVPPTLTQMTLSPTSLALAPAGTAQFSVTGTWSDGSSSAPAVTYSATGGTITAGGLYTAGATAGIFRVIAAQTGGTKVDTSVVTISAVPLTLTQMVLSPTSIALAPAGTAQFSVAGAWSDGSSSAPAVTFSATGGTMTAGGLYTAGTTAGTFRVIAAQTGGPKVDTSVVTITAVPPTLTQMTLSPTSLALAPGGAGQFSVAGTWSDGSSIAPAVTYSATGGTIIAGGLYTAGTTAGTFRVIAAQTGGPKVDTSVVTITAVPPTLTQMTLSPTSLALAPGRAGQFSVAGTWSDGSSIAPAVTYSATGGTITAGGLYTAGAAAGTFRVIAAQTGGTKVDTSVVTITAVPPTLTQMVLSPTSVTLAPAGTAQFSVAGTWSDGSPSPPAVTYSAPGGTITAGGLYTAGATAGTFRVIATQQGGPKVDTAVVTLTTPRPTALALVTQPAGAVSGQPLTQAPVIELRSAQNQSVLQGGVVVTVSAASGPGTLSGTLTSTTNSQGRATFGGLQINGTGDYTLAFTSSGLAQVTSQNVTVVLPSLRLLAAARGFTMGAGGLSMDPFRADPSYRPVLATQYNAVTFGYVLQFVAVQPAPTQYSFADADEALAFARANGMAFHGHTLVWHNSLPAWITNGTFTRGQLLAVLKDHITTVVGRYRGNIATWDVVNEVMGDNGSSLRNTIWLRTIGPDYIDSAFVWAHRADPAAKLYLNDYSAEAVSPKADSILQLVLGLRARSIPIDGVGFQTHFSVSSPAASSIRANFARFASAGFDIRVSEMDVQVADGAGSAALETQGATYRNVLDACLLVTRCTGFTTWGFTDRYSWIPASFLGFGRALPLDSAYQAKPAFDSLIVRLRRP